MNKKKDSSNAVRMTNLFKRVFYLLERENFVSLLETQNSSFAKNLLDRVSEKSNLNQNPEND